jgi:hypothetical protein
MSDLSLPKISTININIVIIVALAAILILVYLKTNKFELFRITRPNPTLELLNNDTINNSALVNFINNFIVKKRNQNTYSNILQYRQHLINMYSNDVLRLINPSNELHEQIYYN